MCQPHTDQKPTELPRQQSVQSKKVFLHFWCSRVCQTRGGEKQWNASVYFRNMLKKSWPTESHRMNEDLELHFGLKSISIQSPRKTSVVSINMREKMFRGKLIGYVLNSGGGLTGDLIIGDRHDIRNNVASEVHFERFTPNKLESKEGACVFFPQTVHQDNKGTHNVKHCATRESMRREYPLLWTRRLQQETGGVAEWFEADPDAMEASEELLSLSGKKVMSCSGNNCM